MDQSFSERSFWKLLRKGDAQKYALGKDRAEIRDELKKIEAEANKKGFDFTHFCTQVRNKSTVFTTSTKADEFILRKVADNLRRALRIRPADRNNVVPQIITLAKEAKDVAIYKFDISRFFESIDRDALLSGLQGERYLSPQTTKLITTLFRSKQLEKVPGIPRGLSISPILAEYYLKDFESKIRRLSYCYYHARYVDDMIFFCHAEPGNIEEDISAALPKGLTLNQSKTAKVEVCAKGLVEKSKSTAESISYLGYEIAFPRIAGEKTLVTIPKKKVSKIKSRIALSIITFTKDRDYSKLLLRIKFLTSNFKIGGSKRVGILYSGIYYNHQYLDPISAGDIFDHLDEFLQKMVYAKNGSLGRKLGPLLTNKQRKEICSHSFRAGHSAPIYRNFTNKELGNAKEVWAHA